MPNQMRRAQQTFEFRAHGGARTGAGRKRTLPGKPRVSHRLRPVTKARFPIHVTMRMRRDVPRLRNFELCAVLRRAFVYGCKKDEFRICQFSIQRNHIHLMCEANDNTALARGIQGWAVRVARGINAMDPFSSAWWFDGWKDNEWRKGLGPPELRTVAAPETWLLREGWRRRGLL